VPTSRSSDDLRAFAARLEPKLYEELKVRADRERKSMNALLNEALDRHFYELRGAKDLLVRILRAIAADEPAIRRALDESNAS
jgi:hypothetical protein